MSKETAIEWLYKKIWEEFNFTFSSNILEQAKELEKEQIKEAFYRGIREQSQRNLFKHPDLTTPEIYYKNNYE